MYYWVIYEVYLELSTEKEKSSEQTTTANRYEMETVGIQQQTWKMQ